MKPVNKWILLALISATIVVADQVTKYLAVAHLTLPEPREAFEQRRHLRLRRPARPRFRPALARPQPARLA